MDILTCIATMTAFAFGVCIPILVLMVMEALSMRDEDETSDREDRWQEG